MTKTKNRKESILKKAQSMLNWAHLIANIGDKLANHGSTTANSNHRISVLFFMEVELIN